MMYCFDLPSALEKTQVGSKAANLARAIALGMPVPAGFVITKDALKLYLKETGLLHQVREIFETRDRSKKEKRKEQFRELYLATLATPLPRILETEISTRVEKFFEIAPAGLAVRSSAICEDTAKASFAGVYESFLCVSSIQELFDSIRKCWCSFWNPQALDYAVKMGFDLEPDQMAVMIQVTVQAESSGVLFTADPSTGNPWQFVVNSTFGLAQDLVNGSAPADRFVLEWDTGRILEKTLVLKETSLLADRSGIQRIGLQDNQQESASLSDEIVTRIGQMGLALDRAFDLRVDIEWAVNNQDLHLIQVRPITALPSFFPHELDDSDSKQTWNLTDWAWAMSGEEDERLVPPLFRDVWMLELSEQYHMPGDICFRPQRVGQERDFHGYRYSTAWTWKASGEEIEPKLKWLREHEPELRRTWSIQKEEIFRIYQGAGETRKDTRSPADSILDLIVFREKVIQMWVSIGMSAAQWMFFTCNFLLENFLDGIESDIQSEQLLIGYPCYSYQRTMAAQVLGRSVLDDQIRSVFLGKPLPEVIPHLLAFHPECHFLKDYERFCWRFGVRPPNWILGWERWCADPTHAIFAIKNSMLGSGQDAQDALKKAAETREVNTEKIRDHISRISSDSLSRFDDLLTWSAFWVPALDDRKWHWVMMMHLAKLMQNTGTLLVKEGLFDKTSDILQLTKDDLERIAQAVNVCRYRDLYLVRKREYEGNRRLVPPSFLGVPPVSQAADSVQQEVENIESSKTAQGMTFKGQGLSPGNATGISLKIADLNDLSALDALSSEHILVCPAFSGWPDWLSLFMVIKGLVTVQSAQLHHALQIARECGVPYINLPEDDFSNLPDNTRIILDGTAGTITILE